MGTKLNDLLLQELDLPPEVHHVLPVVVDVGLELGGDLRNGLVLKQLKNTSCFLLRESKKASHYNSFGEEQNKLFLLSPRLKGWKEEKEENIFGRGGRGGGGRRREKALLGGE